MSSLEPKVIWQNFSKLNAIPRPSKKEERVIQFIKDFGNSLNLETIVDETGNVIIRKPATSGLEDRKRITLQSHLDMVCQKNNDTVFDFDKEGIKMKIDGDWVTADGTTLGADNGIGVAAIMSLLESKNIPHPPLEALFTVDEETGMTGAMGLKPGVLQGEILLNLDTEEDDEIDIGCAGGVDVTASKNYTTSKISGKGVTLSIKGLQGGHSGMEIHKGLGNSNVLLARILMEGVDQNIQLLKIDSGGLRNAIPREGEVTFYLTDPTDFLEKAEKVKTAVLKEYESIEKELNIEIKVGPVEGEALSTGDSRSFIKAWHAAHNGVYRMSPDIKDLVEASNNIARTELKNGKMSVQCFSRSSVDSTREAVALQLKATFELAGLEVAFTNEHPGWQPKPEAEIVSILETLYKKKFQENPKVIACHAGLECGIIGANYPDMEMISFGPTIKGAHSPDERVNIASAQKFWSFLQDILVAIPKR